MVGLGELGGVINLTTRSSKRPLPPPRRRTRIRLFKHLRLPHPTSSESDNAPPISIKGPMPDDEDLVDDWKSAVLAERGVNGSGAKIMMVSPEVMDVLVALV